MDALSIWAVDGLPEVHEGDDLASLVHAACNADPRGLEAGDVLVIASKIVSKAEGRLMPAEDREAAITSESVRVVASREGAHGTTRIVETRHGFVMAAAGVDASNVPDGHVLLLPLDPDASARSIATTVRELAGVRVGVIITDTFGRPWREGQTDLAIGAAHVAVLDDLRGSADAHGRALNVSVTAVADEVAAAADLVKGKASQRPVAVVRGLDVVTEDAGPGVRALVRGADRDLFRWGAREAYELGRAGAPLEADAETQPRS
ncbi:coenzyme F420-0:L-glutamate ligase [Demequina sp. NBRC 110056]|uniref:coenzyme F420-0:L-glutamate ligase n=1 Tax=Demequina sp. NBRC 110056 TaxID=1570345 RepID=UPI000A001C5D|nr:coenzyme F420-0:L-glutamate ligase [Demequina sp. NBRC 110056]